MECPLRDYLRIVFFFFSSRRRHTRWTGDWSSDVCSSDLLWFLDQLDKSASAAYHLSAALRLTGALDVDALQATLDRLVARHESLRTRFVISGGEPYQEIAPETCGFALQRRALGHLPAAEREETVARLAAQEARAPFDLSRGPLIRGQL